jgi:hypothetical protein
MSHATDSQRTGIVTHLSPFYRGDTGTQNSGGCPMHRYLLQPGQDSSPSLTLLQYIPNLQMCTAFVLQHLLLPIYKNKTSTFVFREKFHRRIEYFIKIF